MDAQLRRGSLDVCVLAAVLQQDSYGYRIIQDLNGVVDISESTLYPILRRLEASGCLTSYSQEYSGRLRKFYSITPSGKKKIQEYLIDFKELIKVYKFIEKGAMEDEE